MAHYCDICGEHKSNESFSGKGHRQHKCKECNKIPKSIIESMEQEQEIQHFLEQSHISKKNIKRLNVLLKSNTPKIVDLAILVLEVALVRPHKKRRIKFLKENRGDLFQKLQSAYLIDFEKYSHYDSFELLDFPLNCSSNIL